MIELLFVVGILGIFVVAAWHWIAAQPASATLIVALFLVPLASWVEFGRRSHWYGLPRRVVRDLRMPNPPEIFYWQLRKTRLFRTCAVLVPLAGVFWLLAVWFPAGASFGRESVLGWVAGLTAMTLTARLVALSLIYWHSSQWLHPMRPAPAGWYRRFMFWLSEDAEFLGRLEKPSAEKARAVY